MKANARHSDRRVPDPSNPEVCTWLVSRTGKHYVAYKFPTNNLDSYSDVFKSEIYEMFVSSVMNVSVVYIKYYHSIRVTEKGGNRYRSNEMERQTDRLTVSEEERECETDCERIWYIKVKPIFNS